MDWMIKALWEVELVFGFNAVRMGFVSNGCAYAMNVIALEGLDYEYVHRD